MRDTLLTRLARWLIDVPLTAEERAAIYQTWASAQPSYRLTQDCDPVKAQKTLADTAAVYFARHRGWWTTATRTQARH